MAHAHAEPTLRMIWRVAACAVFDVFRFLFAFLRSILSAAVGDAAPWRHLLGGERQTTPEGASARRADVVLLQDMPLPRLRRGQTAIIPRFYARHIRGAISRALRQERRRLPPRDADDAAPSPRPRRASRMSYRCC